MDEKQRRLYRNLALYGGIPEMCYEAADKFREFTFEQYVEASISDEFKAWYKEFIGQFNTFFDGVLIGDLFALRSEIAKLDPKADEGYARIYAQYIKLIDRTAPIVERMRKAADSNANSLTEHQIDLVGNGTPQV